MEDRRNVGEGSCNYGDGTAQRVQSLMLLLLLLLLLMMMMMTKKKVHINRYPEISGFCV